MQDEYNYLSSQIKFDDINLLNAISPAKIYQMISKLDKHRNDCFYKFKSDALVNAKDILCEYLTLLFQSAFIHGYLPKKILMANL